MKCPECSRKQKTREGMQCGKCGYAFALDPKKFDGLTDNKLKILAAKASGNGRYHFTRNQLYGAWAGQGRIRRGMGWVLRVMIAAGIILLLAGVVAWAVPLLVLSLIVYLIGRSGPKLPKRKTLDQAVERYRAKGHDLPKLLEQPGLHAPPPDWREGDIYDYGAETIVIVDRDLTVDLLVRNGFHADNRCIVISASGYPDYVTRRAAKLLADRPDLPVYLLHDATSAAFAEQVRRSPPIPLDGATITDLGLTMEQARKMPLAKQGAGPGGTVPLDQVFGYGVLTTTLATAITTGVLLDQALAQRNTGVDSVGFG